MISKSEPSKNADSISPMRDRERITPTLYIGIGGTGKEIMLRLRKRILQALWNGKRIESFDSFPVTSFYYIDRYIGNVQVDKEYIEKDPLIPLIELSPENDCLNPSGREILLNYFSREIELFPHIKEWLPWRELRDFDVDGSFQQIRPVSRLFFFDEYLKIKHSIKFKIYKLLKDVRDEENGLLKYYGLEINKNKDVNIVVLCSLAGGTGSGAFLDMGYLCKTILNEEDQNGNVILYAITGRAFTNIQQRVLANTYAAMAELEYCMWGNPYVTKWGSREENRASKPYDSIYFIDKPNIAQSTTDNRKHLFNMVADVLFEDLHNPCLHRRKAERLACVKFYSFTDFVSPKISLEAGSLSQRFKRAYSSIGQVTLNTQGRIEFEKEIVQATMGMIKAFFRPDKAKANIPTPKEVDSFLKDYMRLERDHFQDFPDFLPGAKSLSIDDYPLINEIITQNGTRLDEVLSDDIRNDFLTLRDSGLDVSRWRLETETIRQKREKDIQGAVDSAPKYPNKIKEQRLRIMRNWDDTLRDALYKRLDNKEKGGLGYTIQLVLGIRDALTATDTGVCSRLEKAADEYETIAHDLRRGYYTRALENLEKAAKGGILRRGPDMDKCLEFLGQAEQATLYCLDFRLRALACREAASMLKDDLIPMLGKPSVLDEGIDIGATGIVAEFERGRKAVDNALKQLAAEIRVLDDTAKSQSPFQIFIPGGELGVSDNIDHQQITELGRDKLSGYKGGSLVLFELLRKDDSRAKIFNQLRGKARELKRDREKSLPSVHEALRAMPADQRKNLFERVLSNAAPWVHASLEMDNRFDRHQIATFIAVENFNEFIRDFQEEITPSLPACLNESLLYYVDSSERGRLVVYTEYTGMPMNVLIPLHDSWRSAYDGYSNRDHLPLHNHKKIERFQRPTVKSAEELYALYEDLKLFLKAVGLGVLRRRPEPDGRYEVNTSPSHMPDWLAIGSEQLIYLTGFPENYKGCARRQLDVIEQQMTMYQKLLASALFSYISYYAYSKIKKQVQAGKEKRVGGIAHHAALAVSKDYEKQFDSDPNRTKISKKTSELLESLLRYIGKWSQEIPDSTMDTTKQEANLDPPEYDKQNEAQNKRWVDMRKITDEQIAEYAGISEKVSSKPAGQSVINRSSPPSIPGSTEYYLALDGNALGPFYITQIKAKQESGEIELTANTLAWRKGLKDWTRIEDLEELSDLPGDDDPPALQ
jgi:hypothetical protein